MKKVLAALSAAFSLAAASAESLSVEDAVAFALRHNVSIERQEITLAALERADSHSWNSASPSLSVGAGATIPTTGDKSYDCQFNVNASVSVSLSANLYTSIRAAKISLELGRLTFDEAVRGVELSVRQSFYGLVYRREDIRLRESDLKLAKSQYDTNLAKYNAGRLSELDVLSAEVSWRAAQPALESARAAYLNDLDSFKQLLGLPLDEEVELSGSLEDAVPKGDISAEEFASGALSSPAVRQLEKKVQAAENSVLDRRFGAYSPTLSASWRWQDVWTKPEPASGSPAQSSALTLSATIPLDGVLPWSAKADRVEDAKDSLRDAKLALSDARTTLARTVDSAVRSISQGRAAVVSKQANVRLARRSWTMTQEAYSRGVKDLLSLQNAQASLLSAEQSLRAEQFSLVKAVLSLEDALGLPFGSLGRGAD